MPSPENVPEESLLEDFPELLPLLLEDHAAGANIFWATADYEHLGKGYEYASPITPELITGKNIIMPRVRKARGTQRGRSRSMAEVFTPAWICNIQNNLIDNFWFGSEEQDNPIGDASSEIIKIESTFNRGFEGGWEPSPGKIRFPEGKTWKDYVKDTRLEITCGEAPYLVSRYDAATGEAIPPERRIGLLDRKLRVVSENTEVSKEWLKWAREAYRHTYGYEWQGDNLLIARENLLKTFAEHYREKFGKRPRRSSLQAVAKIISWNLWQMDGLKGVLPGSCREKPSEPDLFGVRTRQPCPGCVSGDNKQHNGTHCRLRDWKKRKSGPDATLLYTELFPH
ncbi:MAG: hypothetical protein LUE08_01860 [Akkermansiaceae bacterium]|nr:hypothetical protein [Akkermansiaceae bacterium]